MGTLGNYNIGDTSDGLFLGTININNLNANNGALLYSPDGYQINGINTSNYDNIQNIINLSNITVTNNIVSNQINCNDINCNDINLPKTNIDNSGNINTSGNIIVSNIIASNIVASNIIGSTISGINLNISTINNQPYPLNNILINDNTQNALITVDGSSNTLYANQNFKYDLINDIVSLNKLNINTSLITSTQYIPPKISDLNYNDTIYLRFLGDDSIQNNVNKSAIIDNTYIYSDYNGYQLIKDYIFNDFYYITNINYTYTNESNLIYIYNDNDLNIFNENGGTFEVIFKPDINPINLLDNIGILFAYGAGTGNAGKGIIYNNIVLYYDYNDKQLVLSFNVNGSYIKHEIECINDGSWYYISVSFDIISIQYGDKAIKNPLIYFGNLTNDIIYQDKLTENTYIGNFNNENYINFDIKKLSIYDYILDTYTPIFFTIFCDAIGTTTFSGNICNLRVTRGKNRYNTLTIQTPTGFFRNDNIIQNISGSSNILTENSHVDVIGNITAYNLILPKTNIDNSGNINTSGNIIGSNISGSNIIGSNIIGSNIIASNISGSNIIGSTISGVNLNISTINNQPYPLNNVLINDNTQNALITVDGTSNILYANSNATFNSSTNTLSTTNIKTYTLSTTNINTNKLLINNFPLINKLHVYPCLNILNNFSDFYYSVAPEFNYVYIANFYKDGTNNLNISGSVFNYNVYKPFSSMNNSISIPINYQSIVNNNLEPTKFNPGIVIRVAYPVNLCYIWLYMVENLSGQLGLFFNKFQIYTTNTSDPNITNTGGNGVNIINSNDNNYFNITDLTYALYFIDANGRYVISFCIPSKYRNNKKFLIYFPGISNIYTHNLLMVRCFSTQLSLSNIEPDIIGLNNLYSDLNVDGRYPLYFNSNGGFVKLSIVITQYISQTRRTTLYMYIDGTLMNKSPYYKSFSSWCMGLQNNTFVINWSGVLPEGTHIISLYSVHPSLFTDVVSTQSLLPNFVIDYPPANDPQNLFIDPYVYFNTDSSIQCDIYEIMY